MAPLRYILAQFRAEKCRHAIEGADNLRFRHVHVEAVPTTSDPNQFVLDTMPLQLGGHPHGLLERHVSVLITVQEQGGRECGTDPPMRFERGDEFRV